VARCQCAAQDDGRDDRAQGVVDVVYLEQCGPAGLTTREVLVHCRPVTTGQRIADVRAESAPCLAALLVVGGREVLLEERLPQSLLGPSCA
jgi:hypothetical protein